MPRFTPTSNRAHSKDASATRVSLSEVLAALSHALDLTEGQPAGHTVRTCIVGMRMADELNLPSPARASLYNALLLKDAGCSSNASRMSALFCSDDRQVKPFMKMGDWQNRIGLAIRTGRAVAPGRSLVERIGFFAGIARTKDVTKTLIQIRCERGESIALNLGFSPETATAIRHLDEHWNGRGFPDGLSGDGIPILSRIALLAQTVEVFHNERGVGAAMSVASARNQKWFDPALVKVVHSWKKDARWWKSLRLPDVTDVAVRLEPPLDHRMLDGDGLDQVAQAFAEIIDAKSPYTFQHSTRVAEFAEAIAMELGYDTHAVKRLKRAALLHDIGKLGVSSQILEKPGALTKRERTEVERHPMYTWEILRRVGAFAEFARTAALHHERLDGSGYPWQLKADQLDGPARILCVADVYEALSADRPYRPGMGRDAALAIIGRESGTKLCPDAVGGLSEATGSRRAWRVMSGSRSLSASSNSR